MIALISRCRVVRGVRWVSDIPYKARYLLIAAYLASKIARESDKFTFGDEKKGRRKRSRGGVESQVDGPHAGASDPSLQYAPQSFTLERLLAIFKHIYESNHRMYDEESKVTQTASSVPFSTDVVTTHHTHTLVLNGDDRFMAMVSIQ